MSIAFPNIDPVAVSVFGFPLRWYALAYLAGFIAGWYLAIKKIRPLFGPADQAPTAKDIDDIGSWLVLAVILGGRIGYILFYNAAEYLAHPANILRLWEGGMSFHGGLLGVIIAILLTRRRLGSWTAVLRLGDIIAPVVPIGLGLGRLANFVNGELWGRVSDVPWAMVFPSGGPDPRHPSQLYQAGLEGVALGLLLWLLLRQPALRAKPGLIGGTFLFGYGLARLIGEQFREPDAQLGYLLPGVTMGMILCLPMLLAGAALIFQAWRRHARSA